MWKHRIRMSFSAVIVRIPKATLVSTHLSHSHEREYLGGHHDIDVRGALWHKPHHSWNKPSVPERWLEVYSCVRLCGISEQQRCPVRLWVLNAQEDYTQSHWIETQVVWFLAITAWYNVKMRCSFWPHCQNPSTTSADELRGPIVWLELPQAFLCMISTIRVTSSCIYIKKGEK